MEKNITIYCVKRKAYKEYPIGTTLMEILKDVDFPNKEHIVAAKVNQKTEDLSFALYKPKDIEFIDLTSSSGMRVYVRTLTMVLSKALNEIYPNGRLQLEHTLSKGYYCTITNIGHNLTTDDIVLLKKKMQEIIRKDITIHKREKPGPVVIKMFEDRKQMDKALLLKTLSRPYEEYYELGNYVDFSNGALLPSTGYIGLFDIVPYYNGLLLLTPSRKNPNELEKLLPQPKMYEVFNEHLMWNSILGVENVGDLNQACHERRVYDLIKIAEALHEKKIAGIADQIHAAIEHTKFVLIAGPSSSGKTTFSKRLAIQLQVSGLKPLLMSLDNYFVERTKTPLDEHGEYDYESLYALDIDFFNKQLKQLLNGEEIELPTFNFEKGHREFKGQKLKLGKENILLMEGIHALNPELTPSIPAEAKLKIYVSALTTISLDDRNWIPTTDNRLLRRIIRDYRYRGYSAQDTISRWPSVRNGEDKWIFPYQENADIMFNSALIFELGVMKHFAEPILAEVPRTSPEYGEAHRLLKFLKYFHIIHDKEVPPTSLLREFLGGSSFKY